MRECERRQGMDKKRSILNVGVSLISRFAVMILAVAVKSVLIRTCGNDMNGLNALYLSIIGVLSVAELGIGSAINFCMYRPIVEGRQDRVAALYQLYCKLYYIIGTVVLFAGLILTPFVQYFAKDYAQLNVNMHLTFLLMLISVVISYFFGAKSSLLNAHKDTYITVAISNGGLILQYLLQSVVLLLTHSFVMYLCCRILTAFVQWSVTEIIVRKKHKNILQNRQKLDGETSAEVTRSVKAMLMHKVGALLVNTVDSMVISAFVGVIALGAYSNYSSLQSAMYGLIGLIFTSLTSSFGHLHAQKSKEISRLYFEGFHLLNYFIGTVCFLGYYAIIDNLIAILFSEGLVAERAIPFVVTLNGFIQFMRQSALTFRDATGTFYNDRWKPLAEGCTNIVLSILFVKWIGVTGVIVATIMTNLLICHIVEPYVLYKNAFAAPVKAYYLSNYSMIVLFLISLLALNASMRSYGNPWVELLVNGCISVGISAVSCALTAVKRWDVLKCLARETKRSKKYGSND